MTELTLSEKRAIAGSKGGRMTVKRYGKRYMKRLARWGAHVMHSIYDLEPVLLNDFALVHKETREVKALLSGKPVPVDLVISDRNDAALYPLGSDVGRG